MKTYEDLEKMYSKKIRHLKRDAETSRVDWDVYDPWDDTTTHYHTNDSGEGLWIDWDYMKQISGTCQFVLYQDTMSGVRKALIKYFNK